MITLSALRGNFRMLEKTTRMNQLYDIYGELLSDKQRQYMEYYYLDNLSLGEIAEESNVSRQAVYDQIRRAEASLEFYEEHLGLLKKAERREKLYQSLEQVFQELEGKSARNDELSRRGIQILNQLREID